MRAILLASATAATLIGRRSIRRMSQGRFVPCWRAYRMAIAPATSSQRIMARRRKPVGHPDRRLANCSRLRRVAEKPAVRSTPFARQVAASHSPLLRMRFLWMGAVLPQRTAWPQRLSRDTSPSGATTSLGHFKMHQGPELPPGLASTRPPRFANVFANQFPGIG
jgi:hypothetical protein